jgi:hypothetical protein
VTRVSAGHVRTISVGKDPLDVSAGEGAVWVASGSGSVSRIDPRTDRVTMTVPLHNPAAGIAAGLGSVWVTVSNQ